MIKKILLGLSVVVLLIGIAASLWAFDGCKKAYSKCTEGGCGTALSAETWKKDCRHEYFSPVKKIAPATLTRKYSYFKIYFYKNIWLNGGANEKVFSDFNDPVCDWSYSFNLHFE